MPKLKKTNFSRPQLALFCVVFALVGYLIFRAFASPNPNLPGDLNNDNTVNITDLSILLTNYGTTNSTADINADGAVNVLDMSILLSHYGQSVSSFSTNLTQNMTINTPFTWTFNPGVTTTNGYFFADGTQLTKITGPGPYSFNLTTTTLTAGTHTLGGSWDLSDGTHVTFPQSYTVTINNGTSGGGTGTLRFQINYETGNNSQWTGGTQCLGTNDSGYTYGTMTMDTATIGEGKYSARFDLPSDTTNGGTRCEGLEKRFPVYGSDHWYGMMYKFPTNWQEPSSAFWGMAIAQLNYELIWGAPVLLAAHADKVDLTINTGFCNDVNSTSPGCTYSSTNGTSIGNVPETKIIPGPIVTNNWYEVIVHAKWTGDPTQGIIEGWYRLKGQTTWNKTVNLTGYPTIQWSSSAPLSLWQSNPSFYVNDKFGVYRGQSTFPMTFWHDNIMDGTDFNSVSSRMP